MKQQKSARFICIMLAVLFILSIVIVPLVSLLGD